MAKSNFWLSGMERMAYDEQITYYKGEQCTMAEARARKAADTRKRNAELRKKSKEVMKDTILPDLIAVIKKTKKSVRNLKSMVAFVDNGKAQWHSAYTNVMSLYPELSRQFGIYHSLYRDVEAVEKKLDDIIKKNKTDKAFFGVARDFGFKMWTLLDQVDNVSKAISESGVLDSSYKTHEIVIGSTDGRRVGLRHIISNTCNTKMTTQKNLVELNKLIEDSYDMLVEYKTNGKLLR